MPPNSRLREARQDTQIQLAPEDSLLSLSRMYSLPWLKSENVTLEAQRAFLQAVFYGARGTYSGVFSAVRALFSYAEIELTNINYSSNVLGSTLSGNGLDESWGPDRFIEITHEDGSQKIYRSVSWDGVNNQIILSTVEPMSHTAAKRFFLPITSQETITARLLPFRLLEIHPRSSGQSDIERPCEIILEIDQTALVEVPPSYYRDNGNARTTDPQGLQVMDLFDTNSPDSGTPNGPFPLYYDADDAVSEYLRLLLDQLVAAGIKFTARRRRM